MKYAVTLSQKTSSADFCDLNKNCQNNYCTNLSNFCYSFLSSQLKCMLKPLVMDVSYFLYF